MRRRLTVREMMGLVAIAGVSAAAARVHPALGCFVFSGLGLAALRTSTEIERLQADGASIRPWKAAPIFLASMLVPSTILVAILLTVILFSVPLFSMWSTLLRWGAS